MSRIPKSNNIPADYSDLLQLAVTEIRTARKVIAKQINSSTNSVYWNLGKLLFERQIKEGYGSGVVKQLSVDLKHEFPDMGLSPRNLWDMKRFYERYTEADTKLRQLVAVLPWVHHLLLVNKVKDDVEIALQDINKPIGVAAYQLLLPKEQLQTLIVDEINNSEKE
ncbi:DUF1016 N-terminal domain-containing protein [Algoriphagus halophytocola]|uniref:DUF1016 N-terminal domain-containing protein n=1 Tax=Algoriphagus halophytocola TaxID=2991499 RepID=UPI0022DDBF25|nr:DUF1016 N-terminal domain-containing protein [Algoriphagus sp. TR-M9]WBL44247.1 DUF1016 N-terminal domain-containing protein [Algoriphagus sp. TR-M9]